MRRSCPVCNIGLMPIWLQRQHVDKCSNCGGTFFDFEELGSIISLIELYTSVELREPDIETVPPARREKYSCPADGNQMERKDYGGITVDVCKECTGVWLDDGELFSLKTTENHIKENLKLYIRLGQ